MAGEAHLKVAASYVRRAAHEKQTEISQLHNQLNQTRNDIEKEISELDRDIHVKTAEMTSSKLDDSQRQQRFRQAEAERSEIDEKRRAITQVHDAIKRQIADVENQMRRLEGKAQELERGVA